MRSLSTFCKHLGKLGVGTSQARRTSLARMRAALPAVLLLVACFGAFLPNAQAAAPTGNGISVSVAGGHSDARLTGASQNAAWLAQKNAFRVRSGVTPRTRKGDIARPYVMSRPGLPCCGGGNGPNAYTLSSTYTRSVYEPGPGYYNGTHYPNFGSGTAATDDVSHGYTDSYFWDLCGPGAADVALYYWPYPTNNVSEANVRDPSNTKQAVVSVTTWHGSDIDGVYRMRGYMFYLGFLQAAPGYINGQPGMMEQYAGGGTTLQTMTAGLNWEQSGHGANGNFYALQWNSSYPTNNEEGMFKNDVEYDIGMDYVPVVAEVNAHSLPNWPSGNLTRHFITIIGYDNNAGTYTYFDTCGASTHCGSNYDGQPHTVSQSQMWNAVNGVPYLQSTGDGGWVW